MKKTFGFISGAVFTAALIITCGSGNKGQAPDAGQAQNLSDTGLTNPSVSETGLLDRFIQRDLGVGEARAQGQPAAANSWTYGYIDAYDTRNNKFIGTPTVDCSSCAESYYSSGIYHLSDFICCANIAGSAGWELVSTTVTSSGVSGMVFKRPN